MSGKSCIVQRFEELANLSQKEKDLLSGLEKDVRHYGEGRILRAAGQEDPSFYTLQSGWACTICLMPDGQRQVLDLYMAGQVMGLNEIGSRRARTELVALTDIEACPFPASALHTIFSQSVLLTQLFFLVLSRDHTMLVERTINMGKRNGVKRLAHFLLELRLRIDWQRDEFYLPFNQSVIADALGMSSVHVSRSLSKLKRLGLIAANGRALEILDRRAMERFSGFDPAYLETAAASITPAAAPLPTEFQVKPAAVSP